MQISITGIVYFPVTIALAIVAIRLFRGWKAERSLERFCYALAFSCLSLVCTAGLLAGTMMTDADGIRILVAGSMVPVTVANGCFAYLYVHLRFRRLSPWLGFAAVAAVGLFATLRTLTVPMNPVLEAAGGVDWGMPADVAMLRSLVYLIGMGPLAFLLIGDLRRTNERSLVTKNLILVLFFFLALSVVLFDFIIEPLFAIRAHYSEVAIMVLAVLGMLLYFILYERVISRSRKRFGRLVENMHDMVFLTDSRGVIQYANTDRSDDFLGYRGNELNGRSFHALVFPDDLPLVRERFRFDDPAAGGESFEFRLVHAGGHPVWVESHGSFLVEHPEPSDNAVTAAIVCRDITGRRALESGLRQSQKMQAVGLLAGGVAHDFNNLLTVINGYCDSILDLADPRGPVRASAEEIRTASRSAASLIRQLLAFSRKQTLKPRIVDLNLLTDNMSRMLRRLIGKEIEFVTRLDPELKRVEADAGQIEQVLLNLVVNAREAMPEGGRLLVETANVRIDGPPAGSPELAAGDYATLTVSDTGIGMDEDTLDRIFEPFFTTGEEGQRTGLGLSTVYGIVRQSHGHVTVSSEPGGGSSFTVFLPAAETPVPAGV